MPQAIDPVPDYLKSADGGSASCRSITAYVRTNDAYRERERYLLLLDHL